MSYPKFERVMIIQLSIIEKQIFHYKTLRK